MAKLLDAAWRNYSEKTIPADIDDNLRMFLRDTFYKGVISVIATVAEAAKEPLELIETLDGIATEVHDYLKIQRG